MTGLSLLLAPAPGLVDGAHGSARPAWSILGVLPLVYPSYVGGCVRGHHGTSAASSKISWSRWASNACRRSTDCPATWVLTIFTYPVPAAGRARRAAQPGPGAGRSGPQPGLAAWQTFRHVTLPAASDIAARSRGWRSTSFQRLQRSPFCASTASPGPSTSVREQL
ncbi:MAG: hypothetical protein R2838_11555 [Caldilineaceae bacterium]